MRVELLASTGCGQTCLQIRGPRNRGCKLSTHPFKFTEPLVPKKSRLQALDSPLQIHPHPWCPWRGWGCRLPTLSSPQPHQRYKMFLHDRWAVVPVAMGGSALKFTTRVACLYRESPNRDCKLPTTP